MARDIFVLGDIGSGNEIELIVQEFAENANYRMQGNPFDENRRGGFNYPRRYGPTQITCEVFLPVVGDGSNDELDILFGELRSKIYTLTQTNGHDTGLYSGFGESRGLTKLYTMNEYFYEVILENIVERERTMYSIMANVSFIAPKGLKVFDTVTSNQFATGSVFTWDGPVAPDVYIDVVTVTGVPVTVQGVTINPTSDGIISLDCTRGKAWRGSASAMSEVTGTFPAFLSRSTIITYVGTPSIKIYYRKSLLG